jgi:hypothetical protein
VVKRKDGSFLFALIPGDRQISWPKLRALVGVNKLSLPTADVALAATGYERGTITPLGSTVAWPVFADRSISGRRISMGAGEHGYSAFVDADALTAALDAVLADISEPTCCELDGPQRRKPRPPEWTGFPGTKLGTALAGPSRSGELLEGNAGASFFELCNSLLGCFLGDAFENSLGSAVNQVLGFLEAQGSDCAYFLDHCDLLVARVLQDDVEFGLLCFFFSSAAAGGASNCNRGCGNFEGLFEELDELGELDDGQFLESFNELFVGELRHGVASFL